MMTTSRDHEGDEAHPDLVALIREELSNDGALTAGEHLDACEQCRIELSELVVGASIVRRAARTLSSQSSQPPELSASSPLELPPLLARGSSRASRPRLLICVAAVAVLGVLGALTVGLLTSRGTAPDLVAPTPSSIASVATADSRVIALDAVVDRGPAPTPDRAASGRVRMSELDGTTRLTFVAEDLPDAEADEFFEAWLLDPTTSKMLPLGLVARDAPTTFEVADALMAEYTALDLSLESDDGNPRHSAISVLRGTY